MPARSLGGRLRFLVSFDRLPLAQAPLRNPWGPVTSEPAGLTLEDSATGLYSMNAEEFRERVTSIRMPKDITGVGGNGDPDAAPVPRIAGTTRPTQQPSMEDEAQRLRLVRMRHLIA